MSLWRIFLSLIILYSFAVSQVNLETSISKNTLMIGEPTILDIYIEYPPGYVLDVPDREDSFAPFEILGFKQDTGSEDDAKLMKKHLQYQLAIYDTGTFAIPPAMVIANAYQDEKAIADTLFTTTYPVFCMISKPDTMQAIHPPAGFSKNDYTWYMAIILVFLLIVLYFLWRWYVKRKAASLQTGPGVLILEPPEVIALGRLNKLKKSSWLKEKKYKRWYTELNLILREYIENRHLQIKALELPSSDLIPSLDNIMAIDDLNKVKDFFSTSDLVKFARFDPDHISHMDYLNWVEFWINEDTRQVELQQGRAADDE